MTIIGMILFIIIVGLIMWLVNKLIPMPGAIKGLLNLIVFVLLVIYVLQFFGVINTIIPMPFKVNV
ncbi:MAG: hypothetical protein P1U40_05205 [Coxiellaceae bacterium]|nr:hypothetical protein [Coxiellaceae bacterium]